MIKIMFVCHGNICRSPIGEFVLKEIIKKANAQDRFSVSSSATSTDEIGSPVYPPARRELASHGISCDGKYAVQLKRSDYDKYDMFIGMDSANIRNMNRIFGADPEGKIFKMMDFTPRGGDVADPWYTGDFKTTYADIEEACTVLFEKLLEKDV